MKRGLATYAIFIYAFLHLPLLVLAVFSVNASRFTAWQGFSLRWYTAMLADRELLESAGNSLIIAVASTVLATALGTMAAYALWKRSSSWLAGGLYLSLVTPEIVTGVSLLVLFQWSFRYLGMHLGMPTVILAHVSFSIAYVAAVVLARLRGFLHAGDSAVSRPRHWSRGNAGVHHLDRRLCDHQSGGGRRFANTAYGDLCDGAAWN